MGLTVYLKALDTSNFSSVSALVIGSFEEKKINKG